MFKDFLNLASEAFFPVLVSKIYAVFADISKVKVKALRPCQVQHASFILDRVLSHRHRHYMKNWLTKRNRTISYVYMYRPIVKRHAALGLIRVF